MEKLIYGKIAAIMKSAEPIAKDQYNQQQRYNFRGIDDFYNGLQAVFAEHGVFTTSEILNSEPSVRTTKSGTSMYVEKLVVRYHFWAEDGSSVFTDVQGEAMDMADKASNKAFSAAHKIAMMQILMLPTDEKKDSEQANLKTGFDVNAAAAMLMNLVKERGGQQWENLKASIKADFDAGLLNEQKVAEWKTKLEAMPVFDFRSEATRIKKLIEEKGGDQKEALMARCKAAQEAKSFNSAFVKEIEKDLLF